MSKKNKEIIKRKCQYLATNGKGVVNYKGNNLHVPYMMPGEVAEIEVRPYDYDFEPEMLSIENESEDTVEPPCEYYYECGGCHLQHMTYDAQLNFKEGIVKRYLGRYGQVNHVIDMDPPYDYRHKVHSTFATTQKGRIVSGLYKESSHAIIPINRCIIQDPKADELLKTIRKIFKKYKMRTYNEYTKQGFLRHVLIRTGYHTDEVMVVFVVAHNRFHSRSKIIKELIQAHPEISTIIMNINDRETSVVLGDHEKVLYGNGKIKDSLCGLDFLISSKSFYQVNPQQTEKLYKKAMDYADLKTTDTVLDAYCGIGTIGLIAAQQVKKVYGIENNPEAVANAKSNAKLNNIENIEFYTADAGEFMEELTHQSYTIDVVFMDPPRSGSDEKFLRSVAKLKPKKIIYISCNPETQGRDLEQLTKEGYLVKNIQPVDMFPQTYHIENIVLLELIN